MSSTLPHTLVVTLSSSCHKLHTSPHSHHALWLLAPLFLPLSRAPVTSSTLLHTVATLFGSWLHSSCHSLELLSRAPLFYTQLPHSLALSLLMYEYVRVILILYKPPGEEDEFLTLCFNSKTKVPPKSLLLTSPLLALHSTLTSVLTFRHITQSTLNQPPHLS
jgi:hypothetical protein